MLYGEFELSIAKHHQALHDEIEYASQVLAKIYISENIVNIMFQQGFEMLANYIFQVVSRYSIQIASNIDL